jgi:nicotinamidase-related amidase
MSSLEMLSPQNCAIALIDFQPAMYQGVQSHDRLVTFNNVQVLAKASKLFKIPTVYQLSKLRHLPDSSCRRSPVFSRKRPSLTALR